jgi:diphthine synthase
MYREKAMLTFVGLGLYDKTDISEKGLACIRQADHVFLESYTSCLMGSSAGELAEYYHKPVHRLYREDVEQHPEHLLDLARNERVAFLCAGDPMVSTTHADLRIRAAERGIRTSIIHAASILSAVCGLSGLQNYRFGKSCSLPFPQKNWFPTTPFDVIAANLASRLHTIVYLDIRKDRFMTIPEAVGLLEQMAQERGVKIPLYAGIARAGSDDVVVRAGTADAIRSVDFGPPLHILVIPAELHEMEQRYLEVFAGL